jgi:hypothetical protein
LYQTHCQPTTRDTRAPQHLEWLIQRAFFRELRHDARRRREWGEETAAERQTGLVLRRLLHQSQVAAMDELVERSGVSAGDREWIRLEATRNVGHGHGPILPDLQGRLRRVSRRRTASLVRHGLIGVGCIAFVEVVLVVWHSLR